MSLPRFRGRSRRNNQGVSTGPTRMVFLGFGKFARADKIYALEPLSGKDRGHGARTRVWVEGVPEPIVASRTERTIVSEMGGDFALRSQLIDQGVELAERLLQQTDTGRVDLNDLSRRARRLLEATAQPPDDSQLF